MQVEQKVKPSLGPDNTQTCVLVDDSPNTEQLSLPGLPDVPGVFCLVWLSINRNVDED